MYDPLSEGRSREFKVAFQRRYKDVFEEFLRISGALRVRKGFRKFSVAFQKASEDFLEVPEPLHVCSWQLQWISGALGSKVH